MSETAVTIIRPQSGLRLDLGVFWRCRDLLWSFVRRDVKVRYQQTVLGPLWLVIQPLMMSGILTAVMHSVAGLKTNGHPLLFYFSAIILWQYFSQAVSSISQVFVVNEYLFSKVYFPRIVVPASIVLANAIGLAIQVVPFFLLMAALAAFGQFHPSLERIWMMPVALIELIAAALGFGLIVASSAAKYRDLANATPFLLQAGMFVTPVLFPLAAYPESVRLALAFFDPLSIICEIWRSGALGGAGVTLLEFGLASLSTLTVVLVGIMLFQRVERTAADTI